jgi:hypothetical protein
VVSDARQLIMGHQKFGCSCGGGPARIVVADLSDITYHIDVPPCIEWGSPSPVRSAMEFLSRCTQKRILPYSGAEHIIQEYAARSLGNFLETVTPVTTTGFNHSYWLARDVWKFAIDQPYFKCKLCGTRACQSVECKAESNDRWHIQHELEEFQDGTVYMLLHQATQILKIGFSSQPKKRIATHRAAVPGELTLIGTLNGTAVLEKNIHEELAPYRVPSRKEWFFYTPEVQRYTAIILGPRNTMELLT